LGESEKKTLKRRKERRAGTTRVNRNNVEGGKKGLGGGTARKETAQKKEVNQRDSVQTNMNKTKQDEGTTKNRENSFQAKQWCPG